MAGSLPLSEKVALVTGGAARIGRVIVRALAAAGCDVVIHYGNSAADAAALSAELKAMGRQAWLVQGDLADEGVPEKVMRAAWEAASWIDIVVNNAATYSREPYDEADAETFARYWRVNALAPMLIARIFSECAKTSDVLPPDYQGRVVNILDAKIGGVDVGALPYWLSKKTLEAFTRGGAAELASCNITVNGVAPGPVLPPSQVPGDLAGESPLPQSCTPEDVAAAVVFLAEQSAMTGQILYTDCGRNLLR